MFVLIFVVIVEVSSDSQKYEHTPTSFSSEIEKLQHLSTKISYSIADGKKVGEHEGAHYFTNGQRKGLAVGGTKEPLFVIATDVHENVIYTGQGKNHPGLYRRGLFVKQDETHWIREDLCIADGETLAVMARIRYRQKLEKAVLHQTTLGVYVIFENPQSAITAGQFVAWYHQDECLGSGVNYISARHAAISLVRNFNKSCAFDVLENHKHIDISAESAVIVFIANIWKKGYQEDAFSEIDKLISHNNIPIIITNSFDNRFDETDMYVIKIPCVAREIVLLTYVILFKKLLF
mgnify:CR=1 FL=1